MYTLSDVYGQTSLGNVSLEDNLQLSWNTETSLNANLYNSLGFWLFCLLIKHKEKNNYEKLIFTFSSLRKPLKNIKNHQELRLPRRLGVNLWK